MEILVVGIVWLILMIDLAKVFGKSTPFAVMLAFIPMIPLLILAFSDAEYCESKDPYGPRRWRIGRHHRGLEVGRSSTYKMRRPTFPQSYDMNAESLMAFTFHMDS